MKGIAEQKMQKPMTLKQVRAALKKNEATLKEVKEQVRLTRKVLQSIERKEKLGMYPKAHAVKRNTGAKDKTRRALPA